MELLSLWTSLAEEAHSKELTECLVRDQCCKANKLMLAARSVSYLRSFPILNYLHIHNEMSWGTDPTFEHAPHCFLYPFSTAALWISGSMLCGLRSREVLLATLKKWVHKEAFRASGPGHEAERGTFSLFSVVSFAPWL